MTVYVMGMVSKTDPELYAKYEAKAAESAQAFGIQPLIADDNPILLEGNMPGKRAILLAFESEEAVHEWYRSEIYTEARRIRAEAAETPFLVIARGVG